MLAALTPGCFISTHRAFPTTIPSSTGGGLLSEELKPRAGLPPLLVNLAERPAERLHYLGVSFGLTQVGTKQSCNSLSQLW